MKKVLALVLAIAMAASLAVVSYAAAPTLDDASPIAVDDVNASADDVLLSAGDTVADLADTFTPGDIIYIKLNTNEDDVKGYKLFVTNTMNSDACEAPVIVYAKVPGAPAVNSYDYYAKIVIKASTSTSSKDVAFDLKCGKTTSSADEKISLEFAVANGKQDVDGDETFDEADSKFPIVVFDDCTDVELTFGDYAEFDVNVDGQDDTNLGWNAKFNSTVAAKYPDANLDFLTFKAAPVFNRNGDLYIYADEGTYFYEVVNGDVKATKATYDEDYGAFVLKTRKLGAYVISDKALTPAAPASSAPVTEDKSNVNTGAMTKAALEAAYAVGDEVMIKGGDAANALKLSSTTGLLVDAAAPISQGTTLYYELDYCLENTDMNKVHAKATFNYGANLVSKVAVEYKKIDAVADYYSYVIAVYTNKVDALKSLDFVGTFKVYKTSINNPYDEATVNCQALTLGTAEELIAVLDYTVTDTTKLVAFANCEDETITFDDIGEFEIDLANQDKLYLAFNTDCNLAIADQYPDADLEFVNFKGTPSFNKTGLFYMYADEGSFLYEVVDGKLVAKNAAYDEDYGALKFAAKKLGSYVISDTELVLAATETKPVVNTGAAVSAISIAVLAAAAAVVLKK